jgi:hypothetical protein
MGKKKMTLIGAAVQWFHDINKQMRDANEPLTWGEMQEAEKMLYRKIEEHLKLTREEQLLLDGMAKVRR